MRLILAVTLVNLTRQVNQAAFGFMNTKILYHQTANIIYSEQLYFATASRIQEPARCWLSEFCFNIQLKCCQLSEAHLRLTND